MDAALSPLRRWESAFSTTSTTGSFCPVRGGAFITQNPSPQPPRAPGTQDQLRQEHAVSQPTNIVPGNSSRLYSNESSSRDGMCFGHAKTRDLLRGRCHSPSQWPTWDLPTVLKGPPFEPLQSTSLRSLSLKTALLLALASVKRVGDLQALSISPACLEFGPNG